MEFEIKKHIKNDKLDLIVKPNAKKTQVLGWDEQKKALKVAIAAVPDKNKANQEVIKFFSKLLKSKIEISKGLKSRSKTLQIRHL